jgi:polar amino acid transport system substrate-binding protein
MVEQTSRRGFLKSSALGLGAGVAVVSAAACSRSGTASGPGSSKLNEVLKRGTVIVGTGSTNPPWHFEDEKGDLQGFDIELARLLAKGLFDDPGKVQFVRQASDARVPNLQTGQVDVVYQFMTVTAQRAQLVDFSIPYYREGVGTLLRRNSAHAGALDLAKTGQKVKDSVLQNVYAEALVRTAIPQAQVMQFDSVANAVLALDSGRVEAAAIDDSTVRWLSRQSPDKYKSGNYGWSPQTYAAALRQGDPGWLNFVNTVLHEAMTGVEFDTYAAGFEKFFGVKLAPPPVGFPIEFGARHP